MQPFFVVNPVKLLMKDIYLITNLEIEIPEESMQLQFTHPRQALYVRKTLSKQA